MTGKAAEAKAWHEREGIVCGTCKHFRGIEACFGKEKKVLTYCELQTYGRGRWEFEYCNLWEAKEDESERSL